MYKVLVTGSNGQVGNEIKFLSPQYNQYEFTFVDRSHFDLSNLESMKRYFSDKIFDFIINCAAYTAVDKAETESGLADAINHLAVTELARIAKEKNISLIHLSTDYVFDGKNNRLYIESDQTGAVNVYGNTKELGEKAILKISPPKSIIIRTSWVYSHYGSNFLKTMLRLGREKQELNIICDQVGTPTCARDLAVMVLSNILKIKNNSPEIYHFSNEGVASWYDFAKAIFEYSNVNCQLTPILSANYHTLARRPENSLFNKEKIKNEFGIKIPYWRDSLKEYLQTSP